MRSWHLATAALAAIVYAGPDALAAQIPLGSEFRVDTSGRTTELFNATQRSSAIAPGGDFVVAWLRRRTGGYDVMARPFDSGGRPQAPEIVVNSNTTGRHWNQAVGIDAARNFVVVWTAASTTGPIATFGQRFDAAGTRLGAEFRVSGTTPDQRQPALAVRGDGDFVVVWIASDGDTWGIFGQRYNASGSPAGAEFQVNTTTTGQQYVPTVEVDGQGDFVVVWSSVDFNSGVPVRAFGQRFSAGGARQGSEFAIGSSTTETQARARVARAGGGSFVVTWWGAASGDVDGSVSARRFDAAGLPLGPSFRVNEFTTGMQQRPEVDMDRDGDFVVTWTSHQQDGGNAGVFARRFDSAGNGGSEFRVNTYTTGFQWYPSVGTDPAGNFVVAWLSEDQQGVDAAFAQRYAGGLAAAALGVDGSASATSNGNGVLEAGETVAVAPSWLNANVSAQTFSGTASSFTGPGGPGNPTYTIADGSASYGTVASNATGSCTTGSDCYAMGVTVPATRPAAHWDASFVETIAPASLGAMKTWALHVGDSFTDVARGGAFYRFVETLLHNGVTTGCAPSAYCPSSSTTRGQMAVFVLVAKERAGYAPPACVTPMFADVPASSPFCPWIEELAGRGVVAGCGGGNYCPASPVSREQMAVFVLRALDPALSPPPCGAPMFADVPASSPFCRWIEELARRGVVAGCGGGNYCPASDVTREQMSVFLTMTFGLLLYGP